MDWLGRLGRIGGFVAAAASVACGRTYVAAPSPDPVPAARAAAACATVATPAGRIAVAIAVAIAGPADSVGASDAAAAVPRLLSQIAASTAAPECIRQRPAEPGGTPAEGQDSVVVRRVSDRGARDALDQGTDILVTRDRAVVAYAAGNPGLVSVPLPWDRVYVLVVRRQPELSDSTSDPLRVALSADAVHADARPFSAGTPVRDSICGGDAPHTAPVAVAPLAAAGRMAGPARILYDREDSVARFLAERIAVLASTGSSLLTGVAPALGQPGTEMYATALPASKLSRAVVDGSGVAYIAAIPSLTPASCGAAGAFAGNGPGLANQTSDRQAAIVQLIETRAWAIVRRDVVSRIAALGEQPVVAEDRAP